MDNINIFLKYFSRVLVLLIIFPLCDVARGVAARWMGDDTAERSGRLTLNPISHLDPIGSILILLIGFGWTKPMPINYRNMRDPRKGVLLTSVAAPAALLISGLVCNLISNLLLCLDSVYNSTNFNIGLCVYILMGFISRISVCLAVLFLLPIPPMDGFFILKHFAGDKFERWYYSNQQNINIVSMIILILLFTLPSQINPLDYLINFVDGLVGLVFGWIPAVRWK